MQTSEIKQYKQFVIEADPQKLPNGEWATYVRISRERPGGPRLRPFDDEIRFAKRIDAVKHCFRLAEQIIDGQIADLTVADL